MAAQDERLRVVLATIASNSAGALEFEVTSLAQLSDELGVRLNRSPNPIYRFILRKAGQPERQLVGFTLALDGRVRPATRAEALGASLALTKGELFRLNPFLFVYDYEGERLIAVSAIELFHAFSEHAAAIAVPYSKSSSFSLSPNFNNSTLSMYAELRPPVVWATTAKSGELTEAALTGFLEQVLTETQAKQAVVPAIVDAIKKRLEAVAPGPSITGAVPLLTGTGVQPLVGEESIPDFVVASPEDEAIRVDERLWRMILSAISSSSATILVGPPGTGKSALIRKATAAISQAQQEVGKPGLKTPLWATPDESWTSRELIGGETVAGGDVVFRPGWVLRAIAEGRWLILDEANRGDLDRIFGALLTWLSGGSVTVGVESTAATAKHIELGWTRGPSRIEVVEGQEEPLRGAVRYLAGDDWRLLGTYNALDSQRVFRLGAALGRRFLRVPIPPLTPSLFVGVIQGRESDLPPVLTERIAALYQAHYDTEATRLGPALFLGMCGYIRSALATRLSQVGGDTSNWTFEESPVETTPTPAPLPPEAGRPVAVSEMGEILAEAYVLNVGTQLAQLEEPDFELLVQRIDSSVALTRGEIEWVRGMTKSLA